MNIPGLRGMYDWTMRLAERPDAERWLGIVAFIESSFFLVPADVLFLPMALARPERAWRLAVIATVGSVLGGIFGYYIGYFAFESVGKPALEMLGKLDTFEDLRASMDESDITLMLVTSGLAHLPPIKVVTILSGVIAVNIWLFIAACVIFRGARFFALAWLLRTYGEPIRTFIEERLGTVAMVGAGLLIALYVVVKYVL